MYNIYICIIVHYNSLQLIQYCVVIVAIQTSSHIYASKSTTIHSPQKQFIPTNTYKDIKKKTPVTLSSGP